MRHGTYSIVALDPATGELGVAVQSHWFSVGPLCAWARAGIGAVATQSVVEPAYGPNALDRLAEDVNAQQALGELLAADPLAAVRQVAVIDVRGGIAAHTGKDCIAHAGHVDRRAPQLPGQHDGPRHRPAGDVRRVRGSRRRALGPPARRARRGRGRGRRRARPPVGGDGRRARRRRALAPDASTCASRTTTRRSTSCGACSRSSAPTTSPGAGDELLAAGRDRRGRRALPRRPPSSPRTPTSCCSGRASRSPRRATSRAAWPRSGARPRRTRTGWSSSTGSHRSSPRRAKRCATLASRSPEGGTSVRAPWRVDVDLAGVRTRCRGARRAPAASGRPARP